MVGIDRGKSFWKKQKLKIKLNQIFKTKQNQ